MRSIDSTSALYFFYSHLQWQYSWDNKSLMGPFRGKQDTTRAELLTQGTSKKKSKITNNRYFFSLMLIMFYFLITWPTNRQPQSGFSNTAHSYWFFIFHFNLQWSWAISGCYRLLWNSSPLDHNNSHLYTVTNKVVALWGWWSCWRRRGGGIKIHITLFDTLTFPTSHRLAGVMMLTDQKQNSKNWVNSRNFEAATVCASAPRWRCRKTRFHWQSFQLRKKTIFLKLQTHFQTMVGRRRCCPAHSPRLSNWTSFGNNRGLKNSGRHTEGRWWKNWKAGGTDATNIVHCNTMTCNFFCLCYNVNV